MLEGHRRSKGAGANGAYLAGISIHVDIPAIIGCRDIGLAIAIKVPNRDSDVNLTKHSLCSGASPAESHRAGRVERNYPASGRGVVSKNQERSRRSLSSGYIEVAIAVEVS